jgi:hypothetical protein
MADIIPFPIKPKPIEDNHGPLTEDERVARLRRIQKTLKDINTLMEKIKDADRRAKRDRFWD